MRPDAIVEWRGADHDDLQETFCLYALVDVKTDELGYIGKAYRSDIATRLKCRSKAPVFRHLSRAGVLKIAVLYGEVILPRGRNISEALVTDIEGLLIEKEDPIANVQCCKSRGISRPNLRVACRGDWPGRSTLYADD